MDIEDLTKHILSNAREHLKQPDPGEETFKESVLAFVHAVDWQVGCSGAEARQRRPGVHNRLPHKKHCLV